MLVVDAAVLRTRLTLPFYFMCGLMESFSGYQRGLGSSVRPMVVSLFSVCAFRVFWAKIIFPLVGTATFLYIVYPISWALCAVLHLIFSLILTKKINKFRVKGEQK